MSQKEIIEKTVEFVKNKLSGDVTGHDWWHIERVWKMAITLAEKENTDLFVVQLAALLHDIADWKFNEDPYAGVKMAREWLERLDVTPKVVSHVCEIIEGVSFKGANVKTTIHTKEGMVVQDADRIDALGAIGISRVFATGAKLNREIHNPEIRTKMHDSFEEYKNANSTSINHFYEKLLLLKDLMNTETGKKVAKERHAFIEQFLQRFFAEWEGRV